MNRLDCKDFKEKIFLYPDIDESLYKHLEECPSCRKVFEDWIKIEEILKIPVLEKEINQEWKIISKDIEKRINLERYKGILLILILTFTGTLSTFIFYRFLFTSLNIPLILWAFGIIIKRISNLFYPFFILGIIFLAVKNELDFKKINGNRKRA